MKQYLKRLWLTILNKDILYTEYGLPKRDGGVEELRRMQIEHESLLHTICELTRIVDTKRPVLKDFDTALQTVMTTSAEYGKLMETLRELGIPTVTTPKKTPADTVTAMRTHYQGRLDEMLQKSSAATILNKREVSRLNVRINTLKNTIRDLETMVSKKGSAAKPIVTGRGKKLPCSIVKIVVKQLKTNSPREVSLSTGVSLRTVNDIAKGRSYQDCL